jgi:hypothetical protein
MEESPAPAGEIQSLGDRRYREKMIDGLIQGGMDANNRQSVSVWLKERFRRMILESDAMDVLI